MTRRYVLTGTPGAGKTTLLLQLERLGYPVVAEAATDVNVLEHALGNPEPWRNESFVDRIVALQRQREARASCGTGGTGAEVLLFDRSPICTHALCTHLGRPVPAALAAEVDRISREQTYQRQVFFVRNLGFVEPTAARRISFADSLRFERTHEETYRAFGYELIDIPPGPLAERAALIRAVLSAG
ncbi:MAG TPA: AAA family ATPase [Mycobacteriales bacterium]|nr:AAA family ATPase [Mycobacteriales bacterium]